MAAYVIGSHRDWTRGVFVLHVDVNLILILCEGCHASWRRIAVVYAKIDLSIGLRFVLLLVSRLQLRLVPEPRHIIVVNPSSEFAMQMCGKPVWWP